jgi:hypothetical protein
LLRCPDTKHVAGTFGCRVDGEHAAKTEGKEVREEESGKGGRGSRAKGRK